jgi:hypothetical protein
VSVLDTRIRALRMVSGQIAGDPGASGTEVTRDAVPQVALNRSG